MTHLLVKDDGDVTTITLDCPEKRNALSLDVMVELTEAFRAAGASGALAVVLAANGPVFSAGHDFGDMAGADIDRARALFDACVVMMDAVQQIPQPVVAKVHALATAAGCQLVATCDLAVASEEAAFALPGGRGGLFCHTPLVGVARNVGRKRALELAMTGDPIPAATAADWGLVNRVVPAAELDAAVDALVVAVTRGSATQKGIGKHAFYRQIDLPQDEAYRYAAQVMAEGVVAPDGQEGIAAFLEKRHPRFGPR